MKRCRAFTLIELLVVVAILALLLAILLPSLGRARKQSKSVACATNTRGLMSVLRMHLQEKNKMLLSDGHFSGAGAWDYQLFGDGKALASLGLKNGRGDMLDKIRVCPETPLAGFNDPTVGGSANTQWVCARTSVRSSGSYGFNTWLYPAESVTDAASHYRWSKISNESAVPVFADAAAHDLKPGQNDPYTPNVVGSDYQANLTGIALNRHNKAIVVSFYDGRAEVVKLSNLWTLRWTANWSRTAPMKI